MRKTIAILMITVLTWTTLCGCGSKQETADDLGINVEFNYYADYWEAYDFSNTPYPTQEEFEALVESEIQEICELLGYEEFWAYANPNAETLYLNVQFQGLSKSEAAYLADFGEKGVVGSLYLGFDTSGIGSDSALSHELTHILSGRTFSISLQEGVCNYIKERIGYTSEVKHLASMGIEVTEQEVLRLTYEWYQTKLLVSGMGSQEDLDAIREHIGKEGWYPYTINTWESTLWYDFSYSFVTYVIEQYGLENVILTMQQGEGESAYEQYIGKSLDELKAEWWTYFEAIETDFSAEELREKVASAMAE